MLMPAPPATAAPMAPAINKRGRPNQKRNSRRTLFRGKKKKMQGSPTPVKRATVEGARSKAKKAPKPNSLPGDKAKLLEPEDEGMGEDCDQSHIEP